MDEPSSESTDAAAVGTFAVFARCWTGFSRSFQFKHFDNLSDEELPLALDKLARRWIKLCGDRERGRATVDQSRSKKSGRRNTRETNDGEKQAQDSDLLHWTFRLYGEVPVGEDLDAYLSRRFQDRPGSLFDLIKEEAGAVDQIALLVPDLVPFPGRYGNRVFVADSVHEEDAELVATRLSERKTSIGEPFGVWRFGFVDVDRWSRKQRAVVQEHLRDPQFAPLRALAAEEVECVAKTAPTSEEQRNPGGNACGGVTATTGSRALMAETNVTPRTLKEAADWLIGWKVILPHLGIDGTSWTHKVEKHLGPPEWSARRCTSLYSVNDLIKAIERAAPEDSFENDPLQGRPVSKGLRRCLKPPDFRPDWADRATTKPQTSS